MTELNGGIEAVYPPFQAPERIARRNSRPLTIALINNMSDAGLRPTERQFCRLLQRASEGIYVNLKFYTLPQLPRSSSAKEHISAYYDNFEELLSSAPDGIIVTGAEPRSSDIRLDPCFQPISRLVDWVEERRIPAIWSCLAAHFAVLHMDGIERRPLPAKLSGVFDCEFSVRRHQLLRGLPASWRVPHSRLNGVSEKALIQNGYSIVSYSKQAGVDIFIRHGGAIQMFFQGHPEYAANTLLNEYGRDAKRAVANGTVRFPEIPRSCVNASEAVALEKISACVRSGRDSGAWDSFDELIRGASIQNTWGSSAERLYANWLRYLDNRRTEEDESFSNIFRNAAPPVLAA